MSSSKFISKKKKRKKIEDFQLLKYYCRSQSRALRMLLYPSHPNIFDIATTCKLHFQVQP